jgi:fluoride exporter
VDARTARDVALGGALGTGMRLVVVLPLAAAVGGATAGRILVANLVGTAVLAAVIARADDAPAWAARVPFLGVGLLGGLTTFSSLAVALAVLLEGGRVRAAIALAAASLAGGVIVAMLAARAVSRAARSA